ncbi:SpoIIE family protein phosphatase [Streptomyces sp. NPDC059740]|uniref:SpoIIE family protein phosphatase n=1 Tax=Streptomyces sp. NPDC059740 TaxID=3346926 RepID=UPI0036689FC9
MSGTEGAGAARAGARGRFTAARGRVPINLPELLSLNRTGTFDYDLDAGTMALDAGGLAVLDLSPGEFDGSPRALSLRLPPSEAGRLEAAVWRAMETGAPDFGVYFRIRCRDGTLRWTHSQGRILRDGDGRAHRVVGLVREATTELADAALLRSLREGRERRTAVVQQTTAALARAMTVRDVTRVLTDAGGPERFGAAALVLGLTEGGRLHIIAATGLAAEVPAGIAHAALSHDLPLADAVLTRRPRFFASLAEVFARYPHAGTYLGRAPTGSAAFLPLIAQAEVIGGLGLLQWEARPQSAEDRDLALALAGVVAQSLQRATLLDSERGFARELQRIMLPRGVPAVDGARVAVRYHAAPSGREIGGDWYDVLPLPSGRVGLVVGDVQGHDTHATAVMGQLRTALRAFAGEGHSPDSVLVRTSRYLADMETERFATCTYVQMDLETGLLRLARAGHWGPLLSDGLGAVDQPAVEGGLPLGTATLFGREQFPVSELFLEPGSTLLLYTDGLVEQPGLSIDEGLDALAAAVREGPTDLETLADHLSHRLWERPGAQDDMVVLLLQRLRTSVARPARRLRLHVHQAEPGRTSEARAAVRRCLQQWGVSARAHDVEVVATEMVTNALTHTDAGALLSMVLCTGPPRVVRLEVEDRSSHPPQLRRPGETGTAGRGLMMIDALADRWGTESRGTGKAVWCEFAV